jgi:hypothetical protein
MKNYILSSPRTPKKRDAYMVGGKIFRTPTAAARTEAWRMIISKYGTSQNISEVQKIMKYNCECFEDSYLCPIHDRQTGYFKRLNIKLARALVYKWGVL